MGPWGKLYKQELDSASIRLESIYDRTIGLLEVEAAVGELVEELRQLRTDARVLAEYVRGKHLMYQRLAPRRKTSDCPHCFGSGKTQGLVIGDGLLAAAIRVLGKE